MNMNIHDWLTQTQHTLETEEIATARLDTLVLLSDVLGKDKSWILAHQDYELPRSKYTRLQTAAMKRARQYPLAYIRGHCEFYGREYYVNPHVLVPRPETEAIIELLTDYAAADVAYTIYDIGTGSGCLAVTAKLVLPQAMVFAIDNDAHCLHVAKQNAKHHGADIGLLRSDLFSRVTPLPPQKPYIILANLPYVPENYPINRAAQYEPATALFSGNDGLAHYQRLFIQLWELRVLPDYVITESLLIQHEPLTALAVAHGFVLKDTLGLAQIFTPRLSK